LFYTSVYKTEHLVLLYKGPVFILCSFWTYSVGIILLNKVSFSSYFNSPATTHRIGCLTRRDYILSLDLNFQVMYLRLTMPYFYNLGRSM